MLNTSTLIHKDEYDFCPCNVKTEESSTVSVQFMIDILEKIRHFRISLNKIIQQIFGSTCRLNFRYEPQKSLIFVSLRSFWIL